MAQVERDPVSCLPGLCFNDKEDAQASILSAWEQHMASASLKPWWKAEWNKIVHSSTWTHFHPMCVVKLKRDNNCNLQLLGGFGSWKNKNNLGLRVSKRTCQKIIWSRWFQLAETQFIFSNDLLEAVHNYIKKPNAGKADVSVNASRWNMISRSVLLHPPLEMVIQEVSV